MTTEDDIRKFYIDHSILPSDLDSGEVVAGTDDRLDLYQLGTSAAEVLQRNLVASTVVLTSKSSLSDNGDGTFSLATNPFIQMGVPPCPGERFAHQRPGGWCSGFMVGDDLIATAGHCGETDAAIQDTAYIFGFDTSDATDSGRTVFDANQVYFGKDLVAHDLSDTGDYAVVRLDRAITAPGAKALPVRQSGEPAPRDNLGVIGYPSGLPVKIAYGDETELKSKSGPWLFANLDTYGGNSGSPVFNTAGEVEGILVRGAQDYVSNGSCFKTNFITNAQGSEAVTAAHVFRDKIPSS